jgi:hypothetical protein
MEPDQVGIALLVLIAGLVIAAVLIRETVTTNQR